MAQIFLGHFQIEIDNSQISHPEQTKFRFANDSWIDTHNAKSRFARIPGRDCRQPFDL